jgi:shikimate kinase
VLIFLIGFMGSGKTTTGRRLAERLGFRFTDLDDLIEENENMAVTEIFALRGEDYFRKAESRALQELLKGNNLVVACGGGTPCFFDNMRKMKSAGITVYLEVSAGILAGRLSREHLSRPLVAGMQGNELKLHIGKLLAGREGWYRQCDIIYNADNPDVDELHDLITSRGRPSHPET